MAGYRRPKHLSCFYCGRKTSTIYDQTTRFECPHCDATNFLDKNGEITDPPVGHTNGDDRALARFSSSHEQTAAATTTSPVFCDTCLKNQRLFTASLAQYTGEEEEAEAEKEEGMGTFDKDYYRFRKNLERRYPQACAECEPRVLAAIDRAGYTAKTDYLRHMLEQSRQARTRRRGWLEYTATVGRFVWFSAMALQILAQIASLGELVEKDALEKRAASFAETLLLLSPWSLAQSLSSGRRFANWTLWASAAGGLWNPFMVQTVRGFTKHIRGLRTWYFYQTMLFAVRMSFFRLAYGDEVARVTADKQAAAHLSMLVITLVISVKAFQAIHADASPLFASVASVASVGAPQSSSYYKAAPATTSKPIASLADSLEEILSAPGKHLDGQDSLASPVSDDGDFLFDPSKNNSRRKQNIKDPVSSPEISMNALQIGAGRIPVVQYSEQMDWQPTESSHRAFRTAPTQANKSGTFGKTPMGDDQRTFWYKVPQAPKSLAHRAFNPPRAPILRSQPVGPQKIPFGNHAGNPFTNPMKRTPDRPEVEFREARLPTQIPDNDPRNTLLQMFGSGLSLGASSDGPKPDDPPRATTDAALPAAINPQSAPFKGRKESHATVRLTEIGIMLSLLMGWNASTVDSKDYSAAAMFVIACSLLFISGKAVTDLVPDFRVAKSHSWRSWISMTLAAVEFTAAVLLMYILWREGLNPNSCRSEGTLLIAFTMGVHLAGSF